MDKNKLKPVINIGGNLVNFGKIRVYPEEVENDMEEIVRVSAKYMTLSDEKKKDLLEVLVKWATEELKKLPK